MLACYFPEISRSIPFLAPLNCRAIVHFLFLSFFLPFLLPLLLPPPPLSIARWKPEIHQLHVLLQLLPLFPFHSTCSRYSFKRRNPAHVSNWNNRTNDLVEANEISRGRGDRWQQFVVRFASDLDGRWTARIWTASLSLSLSSILRGFCFNLGRGIGLDRMGISEKLIKAIIEKDFVARFRIILILMIVIFGTKIDTKLCGIQIVILYDVYYLFLFLLHRPPWILDFWRNYQFFWYREKDNSRWNLNLDLRVSKFPSIVRFLLESESSLPRVLPFSTFIVEER